MGRIALLLFILAGTAAAQAPVRVRSETNLYRTRVRMRPAGDTTSPWMFGVTRTVSATTYEIVDDRGQLVRSSPMSLIVQADLPAEARWTHTKWGAGIGALTVTAAVVAYAVKCENKTGEGPGCGIAVIYTPWAAGLGSIVGGAIGAAMPVQPWKDVKLVK